MEQSREKTMRKLRNLAPAAVLATAALLPAPAAAQNRNSPVFTADKEACYGRVYDRAHLASHPLQKVTSLHVLRSLGERPAAENWQPDQRGELIKKFRDEGQADVTAFVTFKDRKGTFHNFLSCNREGPKGTLCYIDCDGGSFNLRRANPSALLLENEGFVLVGGCGEEVAEGKEVYFKPGQDDKVFRLDAKPLAVCRAEEQKVLPVRSEMPLRERFKEDEEFCFGRDYDQAHLASHPKQLVSTIRVGRLDPKKERANLSDTDVKWWWFNVELDVKLSLRSGGTDKTAHYACTPQQASWECRRETKEESHNACNDRMVQIVRGPVLQIDLVARTSGLPITNECANASDSGQYPELPPTKSDDRTFRLTRMPVAACR
jgi:hypothetical protein